MKKTLINFFSPVIDISVNALIDVVSKKLMVGVKDITLLISTPGGSVLHGISAYNFLKGLPINITTVNYGSVDSIGIVIFCAGKNRISVPTARFLLHEISTTFVANQQLEGKRIEERLKSLRIDLENIVKIISMNSNKDIDEITKAMLNGTTLNPEEAVEWGLVHEIKTKIIPENTEIINIMIRQQPPPQKLKER